MTPPRTTVQYRCRGCGYGVSLKGELPLCPVCQRRTWLPVPDRAGVVTDRP